MSHPRPRQNTKSIVPDYVQSVTCTETCKKYSVTVMILFFLLFFYYIFHIEPLFFQNIIPSVNSCSILMKYLRIDRNFCSVHEEITPIRLYTQCSLRSGLRKGVYNLIEVISNEPNK
jgi:hypothetical protein